MRTQKLKEKIENYLLAFENGEYYIASFRRKEYYLLQKLSEVCQLYNFYVDEVEGLCSILSFRAINKEQLTYDDYLEKFFDEEDFLDGKRLIWQLKRFRAVEPESAEVQAIIDTYVLNLKKEIDRTITRKHFIAAPMTLQKLIHAYKKYIPAASDTLKLTYKLYPETYDYLILEDNDGTVKRFAVTAKCGHVGKGNYIPFKFVICAKDKKDAALIVKNMPRVKINDKYCVLDVHEIDYVESIKIYEENLKDPYRYIKAKHEQKEFLNELEERIIRYDKKKTPKKEENKKHRTTKDGNVIKNQKKYFKNHCNDDWQSQLYE